MSTSIARLRHARESQNRDRLATLTVKARVERTIVLVLDKAGWHCEARPNAPDGVHLVFLPPYTPELQPAETL